MSLAAWGAKDLVEVLDEYQDDPSSHSLALDARINEHIVPYYHDQAKTDSARLAMLRHTVLGTPLPSTSDGQAVVSFPDLGAAAATDPVAFRAFWALMGMLRRPEEIYHDPQVIDIVAKIRQPGPRPLYVSPIRRALRPLNTLSRNPCPLGSDCWPGI